MQIKVTVWGHITAEELIKPMLGSLVQGSLLSKFSGLSIDTRKIRSGELFLAIKGEHFDGHSFVSKALEQGAKGLIVHHNFILPDTCGRDVVIIKVNDTLKALGDLAGWWRRQCPAKVVSITGSSGKTTTKEMTASILGIGSNTLKNRGNFNNLIGLPLTLLNLRRDHEKAVLELGMNQAGEISRLTRISNPDIGVIINIGKAHLAGFKDIDDVARAKIELIENLSEKSQLILNGDDHLLMKTAAPFNRQAITFGLGEENAVRAEEIQDLGSKGIAFKLVYKQSSLAIRLQVPGLHNIANALAAAAIAICLDEPLRHIESGLNQFRGIKGRLFISILPGGGGLLVDDTYNSNPSSLKAALETVKSLMNEVTEVIVVLGEMMELGNEAIPAHQEAGRLVAELMPDLFIVFGEHAPDMLKGAIKAGMSEKNIKEAASLEEIIEMVKEKIMGKNLLFVKGSRLMAMEKLISFF